MAQIIHDNLIEKNISTISIDELSTEVSKLLDLEELDALLYLNLLRMGPVTASALAKELNIDRTKAYRTIDKLLNLKIVSTTFSKPKLCIANKPEDVLKNVLDTKQSQVEKIRNAKDYLITSIKGSIPTNYKSNLPSFHIAQGTDHIYSEVERLLENATSPVYIVTTVKDLAKMYHTDIPEKIKICEKNGAKVCLLTQLSNKTHLPFVKRFGASETRIGNLSSKGRMIVEQGKQMIMSDVVWEDSDAQNVQYDYAICTDSNEIVNNIFTLCSFLWNNGRSLKKRKLSIKN
jgi:sugar-specific transcriptional regulator TrmB